MLVFLHPSASLVSINTTIFSVIKSASQYNSNVSSVYLSTTDFLMNLTGLFFTNIISIYELIFKSINPYSISILILFILYASNLKI